MRELDDSLSRCMRCGFCQEVCPVYGQTFREGDVARGKLALLQDLGRELIRDPKAVDERLNRCLLCSSCESICPPGVGITEIFLRARAAITAYRGLGIVKRAIFRLVLPRPRLFGLLARLGAMYQGIFLKPASAVLKTSTMPVLKPIVGPRHVPSFPPEGFSASRTRILEPSGRSGLKVAYFPGCVPDRLFPGISEATLDVLHHHGVGVVMPEGLCCCGIPLAASGDRKGFLDLIARNVESLACDFDWLVTACATCASTIKETWPRFRGAFSGHRLEMIDRLSERASDLSHFLVNVVKADFPDRQADAREAGPSATVRGSDAVGAASINASGHSGSQGATRRRRVTYHDPCHLRRALKVYEEPRRILKFLPGWEYVEMPEAARCCGSGGSFTLLHPDVSESIGTRKRGNIVSVDPDVVATSCPACMIQLMDMLSRNGDAVEVRHFAELYAESLAEGEGRTGLSGRPLADHFVGGEGEDAAGMPDASGGASPGKSPATLSGVSLGIPSGASPGASPMPDGVPPLPWAP
jgi:glycolate oxidase iron-sulfur subunit